MAIGGRGGRISIFRPNRVTDGKGGWKPGLPPWVLLGEAWATVEDATENERLILLQKHPARVIRATVGPQDFTITTDHRLLYGGINFNVVNVARRGSRRSRSYELLAEEAV